MALHTISVTMVGSAGRGDTLFNSATYSLLSGTPAGSTIVPGSIEIHDAGTHVGIVDTGAGSLQYLAQGPPTNVGNVGYDFQGNVLVVGLKVVFDSDAIATFTYDDHGPDIEEPTAPEGGGGGNLTQRRRRRRFAAIQPGTVFVGGGPFVPRVSRPEPIVGDGEAIVIFVASGRGQVGQAARAEARLELFADAFGDVVSATGTGHSDQFPALFAFAQGEALLKPVIGAAATTVALHFAADGLVLESYSGSAQATFSLQADGVGAFCERPILIFVRARTGCGSAAIRVEAQALGDYDDLAREDREIELIVAALQRMRRAA